MKKSEKVEIRVSIDEKQTLSRLADLEGTSVSELVRNLVRKYVAINTNSTARKQSLLISSALLAAGALIGAALVVFPLPNSHSDYYLVEGTIDDAAFGFPFDLTSEKPHVLEIGANTKTQAVYRLEVSLQQNQLPLIQVCRVVGSDCISTAQWDVDLDPKWPSVFQTVGSSDESVFISVQRMAS